MPPRQRIKVRTRVRLPEDEPQRTPASSSRGLARLPGRLLRGVGQGLRRLLGLPAVAYRAFRARPRHEQVVAALAILFFTTLVAFVGWNHYSARRQEALLSLHWKLFEEASYRLQTDQMHEQLARLRQLDPGQPALASRERQLAEGEGDPADAVMVRYWMNAYLQQGRLDAAARQATRKLASIPDDWQALCVQADWAMRNNRPADAVAYLQRLPSPAVVEPPVVPALHTYTMKLLSRVEPALGRTDREDWYEPFQRSMREYRATRLAPAVRSTITEQLSLTDRVQLLETYLAAFEDRAGYPLLPTYWVPAGRVCQSILDAPDLDEDRLAILGNTQYGLLTVLDELVRTGAIAEGAEELLRDHVERLERIWDRLREMAPANIAGYVGTARMQIRRKQVLPAARTLEAARLRCGPSPELTLESARILLEVDPRLALQEIEKGVQGSARIEDWYLLFQTAVRAARPDKAMEACRQARKLDPTALWVAVYDAELSLARNRTSDALQALAPVRSLAPRSAEVTRLYARALRQTGAESTLQELLKEVDLNQFPAEEVVKILLELNAPERQEYLLRQIDQLVARAVEVRSVRTLQADLYRRAAEPAEGGEWDRRKLDTALGALKWLQTQEPDNLEVTHVLAYLQLKALDAADAALRTAEPLRRAHAAGRLDPNMQLTLGAIYRAVGRPDDARRLLEANAGRVNTAEGWVELALSCHLLGRTDEARAYLRKAASLPRTPRESAELTLALKTLEGK